MRIPRPLCPASPPCRRPRPPAALALLLVAAAAAVAGCDRLPADWDLRPSSGLSTAEAAAQATEPRPEPDARGIISYPSYQVAVARRGDTVATVAGRIGVGAADLARFNGLAPDTALRDGELLVLPARVSEPAGAGAIDVAAIAGPAIDRAGSTGGTGTAGGTPPFQVLPAAPPGATPAAAAAATPRPGLPGGPEPLRHVVRRGESAYTIARAYNVSVRSLAEWNGLGADFTVREGQTLVIPVADGATRAAAAAAPPAPPGAGSAAPPPPSAATPAPAEVPAPAAAPPPAPPSPNLGEDRSGGGARFAMPAEGRITRGFQRGRNDGIDIGAAAGSPVRAAEDGTVAAITRDTDQVTILVIRHEGNLLTVYANIDEVSVERGANVRRGQQVARVRAGDPAFLHFEVRQGFDAVDPLTFLQ
ncbi:MAG: peptidoglycan DD-metalloendopeptidase family protein [Rhodobacteraceae bacterium]|nr:peptidoglycan DD-metalloendopeptidase family protein [Paracoccaceae bacterium]